MKSKLTVDNLRPRFLYNHKGVPLLNHYGVFAAGLTTDEIDDYLRVRTNTMNISSVRRKLNNELNGSTCPVVNVNGQEVILIYRHDVKRFSDKILDNVPTFFD